MILNKQGALIIIISCLLSFVLLLFPGVIRAYSFRLDFVISHLAYFLTVFLFVKNKPQHKYKILLSFIAVIFIVILSLWISSGKLPYVGLPNMGSIVIACFAGFFYYIYNGRLRRMLILFSSLSLCLFYFFFGMRFLLNYINFGNITGSTNENIHTSWQAYIQFPYPFIAEDKLIILDFFQTSCSLCFKAFPTVQKVYERYRNDSNISFFAIDIPLPVDTGYNIVEIIKRKGFTFPVLLAKSKTDSLFNIHAYPTVCVLKNNRIIFRGNIEDVVFVVDREVKKGSRK